MTDHSAPAGPAPAHEPRPPAPPPGTRSWKRRTYIIDPHFQYSFLTTWVALTAVILGVIIMVLYWGMTQMRGISSHEVILQRMSELFQMNAVFVAILTGLLGLYMILLSHRIAGPAYRLRKCLQRVGRFDFDFHVELRQKDYLKNVAEELNSALADLRERRQRLGRLTEQLKALEGSAPAGEWRDRIGALTRDFFEAQRPAPTSGSDSDWKAPPAAPPL